MKFLAVRNFERFQHYSKRNPPWIKLYSTILTDAAFLLLPEAAQAQLVKLWVLASQFGHPLPNEPKLLAGKIGATGKFYLEAIVQAGFLIPCDDPASPMLANTLAENGSYASNGASDALATPIAKSSAFPPADARSRERREEREQRTETTSPPPAGADAFEVASRLASDADRSALEALLLRVPSRITWIAEIQASLDGMSGHACVTPIQAGQAIRDYVGNGATANPSLKHFRSYLEKAARPPSDEPPYAPRRRPANNGSTRNDAAIDAAVERLEARHGQR